jgi:ribosomal-protein-alanine N-acetyltransferase
MRAGDAASMARLEAAVFGDEAWPGSAFAYLHELFGAGQPPRGRFWVAAAAGRGVVGYAGLELSALGGEADVINLAVAPACRRRGVGRRLMSAVVRYCHGCGIPRLWLRVRARNRGARAFYQQCGFTRAGRFRNYYDDPREDAMLMSRRP